MNLEKIANAIMLKFPALQELNPKGLLLKGDEARGVIKKWNNELSKVEDERSRISNIVPAMEGRVEQMTKEIRTESTALALAVAKYRECKQPAAKRRWARRMIYSNKTLTYLRQSSQVMSVNIERANASIEDAKCIGRLLKAQIEDANLYYKLNGQLRLVGRMLASAEAIFDRAQSLEKDFEVGIENIDGMMTEMDPQDIFAQADEIASKHRISAKMTEEAKEEGAEEGEVI